MSFDNRDQENEGFASRVEELRDQPQSFKNVAIANAIFHVVEKQCSNSEWILENGNGEHATSYTHDFTSGGQNSCEPASSYMQDAVDNPHCSAVEETKTFIEQHMDTSTENDCAENNVAAVNASGQISPSTSVKAAENEAIEKNRDDSIMNVPVCALEAASKPRDEVQNIAEIRQEEFEDVQSGRKSQENSSIDCETQENGPEVSSKPRDAIAEDAQNCRRSQENSSIDCEAPETDLLEAANPAVLVCPRSDSFGSDVLYEDARDSLETCSLCGSIYDDAEGIQWDELDTISSFKGSMRNGSSEEQRSEYYSRFGEMIMCKEEEGVWEPTRTKGAGSPSSLRAQQGNDEAVDTTSLVPATKKLRKPLSKLFEEENGMLQDESSRVRRGGEDTWSGESTESQQERKNVKAKSVWSHCVFCS